MIFGKTFNEAHEEEQKKLIYLRDNVIKRFAWKPKILNDGRMCWLQTYYVRYVVFGSYPNLYLESTPFGYWVKNYATKEEAMNHAVH